jgi:primosomal protein N' (replication factor Y)
MPVARVAVDVSLPHLDRPFDYLLTDEQAAAATIGCRLRVRFSGQLVDGFLLERLEVSEHHGRLAFVERVVSSEPVLADEIAQLVRAVADRWAGSFADVVRLAVPPRHATVEARPVAASSVDTEVQPTGLLARYAGGTDMLRELSQGGSPRRSWQLMPGAWPAEMATVSAATLSAGRGVVIVMPDHRDVARVDAALGALLGPGHHLTLTAEAGPADRYRRFLAVRRGDVRCVVGTRAAVWAPVANLGLMIVYDDGDDLLGEPRAPYCHARDVAVLRAHHGGAGLLLAGHAITAEAASLASTGWLSPLDPSDDARARWLPLVRASADDEGLDRDPAARVARLPTSAWKAARAALEAGAPVLVQVPRAGYQPSLACDRCREPARCGNCSGPLSRPNPDAPLVCRWCATVNAAWSCMHCGAERVRAVVVGAHRTAEELGRAFPGVAVRMSGAGHVLSDVGDRPALVVATPGAEPLAAGGYGAALLLDGWAMLTRPDLRAEEETLRRWFAAAALVRPASAGGRVVVVAPSELRPVQAIMRWHPRWYAERELSDRVSVHLPPAARMAALTGASDAVREVVAELELSGTGAEVLGPVAVAADGGSDQARVLVRVPRHEGMRLAQALKHAASLRSARKAGEPVKVELDPVVLG